MATQDITTTSDLSATDSKCHLLDLPAELRNRIWDLSFTTAECNEVDLLHAKAPSEALLLTYRQVCQEAKSMQRNAYRNFWRNSTFTIVCDTQSTKEREDVRDSIIAMSDEDVSNIAKVRVTDRNPKGRVVMRAAGMWMCWMHHEEYDTAHLWWRELWVPVRKQEIASKLAKGENVDMVDLGEGLLCINVEALTFTRIQELRSSMAIGRLGKGELLRALADSTGW